MSDVSEESAKRLEDEQMLSALSELLVSTRAYQNRPDRLYANELAGRIIDAMSDEAKVRAADLLARLSNPPEELLRALVTSSNDAARQILGARYVTDAVLMESASKTLELREMIARRPQLSEPVINKLLFYEEQSVEAILLTRPEVQLSNSRAARLISRVDEESTLGWMLAKRTDIAPRLSLRLFWKVDGDSRLAILKRFNADPRFAAEIFTRMLEKGPRRAAGDGMRTFATLVARVMQADDQATSGDISFQDLAAFRAKAQTTTVQSVADQASISYKMARQIADDFRGDAFAILCRAARVSEKAFAKLAAIKPDKPAGTTPFSPEDRERMKKVFADIAPAAAIAVLSYWEIDIAECEKAELRQQLQDDLNSMQKRLSDEFGEEREERPAAEKPKPEKKRRWF